jgi:hypothetical protein
MTGPLYIKTSLIDRANAAAVVEFSFHHEDAKATKYKILGDKPFSIPA